MSIGGLKNSQQIHPKHNKSMHLIHLINSMLCIPSIDLRPRRLRPIRLDSGRTIARVTRFNRTE